MGGHSDRLAAKAINVRACGHLRNVTGICKGSILEI